MARRGWRRALRAAVAAAALAVAPTAAAARPLLLREAGMVMAHDAGTSYLAASTFVNRWAKTQPSGGLARLLDCGARALDVRSELRGGRVVMHHGEIPVPAGLEEGVQDVARWSEAHPGELVYLYMSHDRGHIDKNITDILERAGVAVFSCAEAQSIARSEALARGPVVATLGCMHENYDPDVHCEAVEGPCWREKFLETRLARLVKYLNATLQSAAGKEAFTSMWMLQAHWQYDAAAIALGILEGSTLIKDNTKSGMNAFVAAFLRALPQTHRLNVIELDNVCASGPEIYNLLKARDAAFEELSVV